MATLESSLGGSLSARLVVQNPPCRWVLDSSQPTQPCNHRILNMSDMKMMLAPPSLPAGYPKSYGTPAGELGEGGCGWLANDGARWATADGAMAMGGRVSPMRADGGVRGVPWGIGDLGTP